MIGLFLQGSTSEDFAVLSLLALIQGLTEFLPISSSGHLVLTQEALPIEHAPLAVDVALHLGTLLAVFVVYRKAILEIARNALRGEVREPLLLALATLPVGVVGVAFGDELEAAFSEPRLAAACLLATALMLVVGEWGRRRRAREGADRELDVAAALAIGFAQALAVLPGVSRSGTTIAMGLLLGLSPERAARTSFLLSIPAILGAAVLALPDLAGDGGGPENGFPALLWAVLFAAFVGWGALRILLAFLARGAFLWFAVYCAALGGGYLIFSS